MITEYGLIFREMNDLKKCRSPPTPNTWCVEKKSAIDLKTKWKKYLAANGLTCKTNQVFNNITRIPARAWSNRNELFPQNKQQWNSQTKQCFAWKVPYPIQSTVKNPNMIVIVSATATWIQQTDGNWIDTNEGRQTFLVRQSRSRKNNRGSLITYTLIIGALWTYFSC